MNKHARSVIKWPRACNQRLARLISYIHHTIDCRQYCHVGNTAQHCRLGLFQDTDCAGDLEDSKSTSEGVLCIFGSRTFVSISWMCKKQTSVQRGKVRAKARSEDKSVSSSASREGNVCNEALHVFGLYGHGDKISLSLFLKDWNLAKVALSCHMALDMLCQEMHEAW